MKKLKSKTFLTLSIILSLFVVFILFINSYRNYNMQEKSIEDIFQKLDDDSIYHKKDPLGGDFSVPDRNNRFFLDATVYTIILDENGNYKELINHSDNNIEEEDIKDIANSIITSHTKDKYVANLYFDTYSYFFNNNTLTIVDSTILHNRILENLYTTIALFIFLEILIFLISNILTNWLTKPALISFNKQKEFIEDASHELKTPLSVILASTDAYYLKKEDKWVNNIRDEANKMTKLVIEMLDLARSENGDKKIYSCENLSKITEKCVLSFESMLFEKNIKLEYKIDDDIYFNCSKEEIERVINILLDNAVNHSVDDGCIVINLSKSNKNIILDVKNKGLPIRKGDEKRIFERFYRADESRNRNSNRYGLGLAIAKNIVNNHNGKIEAFSKDGYTTFRIIL